MTTIFIKTTFVVAVDVGDHYDGVTNLEVAEAAALDQDITDWLHNDMTAVATDGHRLPPRRARQARHHTTGAIMTTRQTHTTEDGIVHLSVADAVEAVERCSFTTGTELDETEREITHVFIGMMGADWNTSSVIAGLQEAVDIAWLDHPLWGMCLAFIDDGRLLVCDTVKPVSDD